MLWQSPELWMGFCVLKGMETSEEARERAEAELVIERKQTVLWERRARAMGWKGKDDPEGVSWKPIRKS